MIWGSWTSAPIIRRTFYETPNIDRLASRGMRFTASYSSCPVCSPSRASLMTGKYPPRTGVTDYIPGNYTRGKLLAAPNQDQIALEEVTIAERLRADGYLTFLAGKWHLGNGAFSPNAQGFGPGLVTGKRGTFYYPPTDRPAPDPAVDPHTTDRIADEAVRLHRRHRNQPFFAYIPFLDVHTPLKAPADLVAKYERKRSSAPPDSWGQERERKVRLVQNHAVYAAMVEQMDRAVGRVLEAIERAGLAERTIVIFTSDNGGLSTSEGHPTSNVPLRRQGLALRRGHPRPLDHCRARRHSPGECVSHTCHHDRLLPHTSRTDRPGGRARATP